MTFYFTTEADRYFTANIANAQDYIGIWTLSLRSKLSHVSPSLQGERPTGLDLSIDVVNSNERYTTFRISDNVFYTSIRDALKNGIYTFQIGVKEGSPIVFTPVVSGVAAVFTEASLDPNKEIIKYTSNNEDNSGFVYYSDTL